MFTALYFKYPEFVKIELVGKGFTKEDGRKLHIRGWKYMPGLGIYYRTYFKSNPEAIKYLERDLAFIIRQGYPIKRVPLLAKEAA